MSIISSVKTYLATYTGLATGAPLWVDHLGSTPTEYAVVPLAGSRIAERYIDGGSSREFPFAFQSMESTADELERLENSGFYEAFADWLESQSLVGTLPTLGAKQTATDIQALGWAYIYEQGQSSTGVYQIQCKLTYEQLP
ncbi:MAG: hypothetical protein JZU60_02130 [Ilumatobacteraceae bacterium]|jgi:hypothetical protein|nr:hypothetical protein [Ilumatobacteraceae bacterium]